MKKILALLLSVLTLMSMAACGGEAVSGTLNNGGSSNTTAPETSAPTGVAEPVVDDGFTDPTEPPMPDFVVPAPMTERPMYLVSENPTEQELRETAVKAMHDMLSIQWSTEKTIDYNKTGAVSHKDYHYDPETIYCGLPYADGQTNLYVWLEYYDYRSGLMHMDGDGQWLNQYLGNTCAGSLMWAWSTVCDSLTGRYVNTSMVPAYGCIPVGPYTYPNFDFLKEYKDAPGQVSTGMICEYNGLDVMFESYALIKMADAITNSKSEHTMMVIEDATVVRDEEGNIHPTQSYVILQDQAAGTGDKFFEYLDANDGTTHHYTGRTGPIAVKMTFMDLFNATYIPVTTVEFLGQEAYVKPEVSFSNENCATVDDMFSGTVTSNYPMCMLKLIATNSKGQEKTLHTVYFNRKDVQGSEPGLFDGKARIYKPSSDRIAIEAALEELVAGTYTITMEATAPNGEVFHPTTFTYTK